MRGFVGVTDREWYEFLRGQPHLDEVNFWQPSGRNRFRAVPAGSPFFFKLHAPHNAIAGYGIFARHEIVPDWLAWEAFGIANGAPDHETMRRRIRKYRKLGEGSAQESFNVGCLMITEPVFFPQGEWIEQPRDWKPNIVSGKGYSLAEGEGLRIWEECKARRGLALAETGPRFGGPQLIQPRLGQGSFKIAVTAAYEGACAVTREHSLPVLEAAHILPYAKGGEHRTANGLLLRTDIHRLYDRHYVSVTPDLTFKVGERLRSEWHNGRTYYELEGRPVVLPESNADHPDRELLSQHYEEFLAAG
ncbi:MAG: HNH endonuclease [Planctomycetes bacterium]|nr:HNH endonuclease [Planctomycetota bacterium]